MHLAQQNVRLPIVNFDEIIPQQTQHISKHGPLFPNSIRAIITGPSGSGKTNALLNLICDPNGLKFQNIYVFSKSLFQPKYQFLEKILPDEVGFFPYDDNTELVQPSCVKPNSIVIFDDICMVNHDCIRNYFAMGRHSNIDIFYIGQTYSQIPKQLIRDNANFLMVFKQDGANLRHIFNNHVSPDMTFEQFVYICSKAWKCKNGFLVICKDSDLKKGRYRLNCDTFICL